MGDVGDEGGRTEVAAAVVFDAGAFGFVDVVGDVSERIRWAWTRGTPSCRIGTRPWLPLSGVRLSQTSPGRIRACFWKGVENEEGATPNIR